MPSCIIRSSRIAWTRPKTSPLTHSDPRQSLLDAEADYRRFDVLPEGVVRVADGVIAAERLLACAPGAAAASGRAVGGGEGPQGAPSAPGDPVPGSCPTPVRIAAFDFDGTSIDGNSPVSLVRYLGLRRRLSFGTMLRIGLWGLAYKLRLPQDEARVRSRVFSAFKGKKVAAVNRYLWSFYDTEVDGRFRPSATAEMERHLAAGHAVVCVSASFEPIIAAAAARHPIQFAIATRMQVTPEGTYVNHVLGEPMEGPAKLEALTRVADERFGAGRWVLEAAYGDHHSDRALLAAAEHACAVCPDRPLSRTARERGYDVRDWEA